jgi:hypothetical protein
MRVREEGTADIFAMWALHISKTERVWLIWHQINQARHATRIASGSIMTRLTP